MKKFFLTVVFSLLFLSFPRYAYGDYCRVHVTNEKKKYLYAVNEAVGVYISASSSFPILHYYIVAPGSNWGNTWREVKPYNPQYPQYSAPGRYKIYGGYTDKFGVFHSCTEIPTIDVAKTKSFSIGTLTLSRDNPSVSVSFGDGTEIGAKFSFFCDAPSYNQATLKVTLGNYSSSVICVAGWYMGFTEDYLKGRVHSTSGRDDLKLTLTLENGIEFKIEDAGGGKLYYWPSPSYSPPSAPPAPRPEPQYTCDLHCSFGPSQCRRDNAGKTGGKCMINPNCPGVPDDNYQSYWRWSYCWATAPEITPTPAFTPVPTREPRKPTITPTVLTPTPIPTPSPRRCDLHCSFGPSQCRRDNAGKTGGKCMINPNCPGVPDDNYQSYWRWSYCY